MTDQQLSQQTIQHLYTDSSERDAECIDGDRLVKSDDFHDVAASDLAHIEPMLRSAYKLWRMELPDAFRTLLRTSMLYDHVGKCIEPSEVQFNLRHIALLERLVMLALQEKRTLTIHMEDASVLVAVPLVSKVTKIVIAVAVFQTEADVVKDGTLMIEGWATQLSPYFYREFERGHVNEAQQSRRTLKLETMRRQVLNDVMRHIHDHIEVDSVLSQIVDGIQKLMPQAAIEVYVSQDYGRENPHVKVLTVNASSDEWVMQAFMKGETLYHRNLEQGLQIVLALAGKQGSYGVLKLTFRPNEEPDHSDIELVQLIVESAGAAFENARLHEQANAVIQELRFINDLTKRINQSLRLRDVFHDATHELTSVFKADFCMLLQYDDERSKFEVVSSNHAEYNGVSLPADSGLFGNSRSTQESIIISDLGEQEKANLPFLEMLQLRSIIAVPLFRGGEMMGMVVVADKKSNFFTYNNYKLLQMLASHLGVAIANAGLHARVKHLANKDQVTGLFARHYLDKQIKRQLNNDFCGSLIMVDIDLFKHINDTYGHQTGDQILKQVAEIITTSIREGDIAARWGGEEFAVYLPQLNVAQTMKVAERIRTRVWNETKPQVSVSCGIADWSWQDEGISVESLFYRADMAMYDVKGSGRNGIRTRI